MDNNRQLFNFQNLFGPPGFNQPGSGGQPNFFGGPPGSGPGSPFPWGTPGGQMGGTGGGPPTTPPPNFTPQQQPIQTFAVDPGAIRGCLFRFTYVWLNRGAFWFFPVFVGRRSVAGYRWMGFRWAYVGIDLNNIQSFTCF